jgi:Tfp pilus assembly protein PilN
MIRINYLRTPSERFVGAPVQLDRETRGPLAALGIALVLVAVTGFVEARRLEVTLGETLAATARLREAAPQLARTRTLAAEVERLRALDRRADALRRSGTRVAARFVLLGNHLPSDAWLSAIRRDGHGLALEGRGTRLAAVGATLATVRHLPGFAAARLVSVRRDPARAGVVYAIAVDGVP